jgi:PAS domain S-box-containing protein
VNASNNEFPSSSPEDSNPAEGSANKPPACFEVDLHTLFEGSGEGIGIVDAGECFCFINPAGERIFGVSQGELTGRSLMDFVDEESRAAILQQTEVRKRGEQSRYVLEIIRPDGQKRKLSVTATPRHDASGSYIGAFGVFADATESKLEEQKLRQLNDILEARVRERTDELVRAIGDLHNSRQQVRMLAAHLESVREEENSRVAREIHDQLGQDLTTAKWELAELQRFLPKKPALRRRLENLGQILDKILEDVRRIARDLRPCILDDLGLKEAMEWSGNDFEKRTGIRFVSNLADMSLDGCNRVATELFRIFQESLTNVARHSHASRVEVNLSCREAILTMTVQDDGRGVDLEKLSGGSFGLLCMRERVIRLKGDISITSSPMKGFRIEVQVPL